MFVFLLSERGSIVFKKALVFVGSGFTACSYNVRYESGKVDFKGIMNTLDSVQWYRSCTIILTADI
jgi:hypothetical protein